MIKVNMENKTIYINPETIRFVELLDSSPERIMIYFVGSKMPLCFYRSDEPGANNLFVVRFDRLVYELTE